MDSFKKTVLYVAVVILIIALVVIGLSISKSVSSAKWPPVIGKCPDFWSYEESSGDCINTNNLGNADDTACPNYATSDYSNCERFNFSEDSKFSGSSELCEKQTWANALGLEWDGITNDSNACSE